MTRFASWLLVLLLFGILVGAAGIALRLRSGAGKGLPEYSIYSEEKNGLAELGRKLRQMGWRPIALTGLANPAFQRGLLVLVEPQTGSILSGDSVELTETDAAALLRWVADGNTLLVCSRRNSPLSRALGITIATEGPDDDETPHRLEPEEAGRYTDGLEPIEVEGRHSLRTAAGLSLWRQDDSPAALVLRWKQGRVIYIADPSFFTERRLHRGADNLVFLGNVAALHAQDRRIFFDEYHHGIRSSGDFWGYLQYHGQQAVFLPILLTVGIAIWAAAKRLGPPVATSVSAGADAVEYASALACIYQRAGARRLVGRSLVKSFLDSLSRHLHLRRSALPAEVLTEWKRRHPGDSSERLQRLLRGAGELRQGASSDRQLLAWLRAFDDFSREEVETSAKQFASPRPARSIR
jgi:hypothetical protein